MSSHFQQRPPLLSLVSDRKNNEIKYVCLVCGRVEEEMTTVCSGCTNVHSYAPQEHSGNPNQVHVKRRKAKHAQGIPKKTYVPISTEKPAWDEALGGGLVCPSTVLVHGPKGTGKTTAMLQIGAILARKLDGLALYGTAEMGDELLRHYAERCRIDLERLLISDAGEAENLLSDIEEFRPVVVVWDSVQAFTWEGAVGETELRNVMRAAIQASKVYGMVSLLVSQVTKDNDFLGPSELGHNVDVILTLRKKKEALLVECLEKNRFASTPRIGEEPISG